MAKMEPGDVRVFEKGNKKALVVSFGLWAERTGEQIHIHLSGHGGHTTVTNDTKSKRYHKTLFRNLRRILLKEDRWPFGDDGS